MATTPDESRDPGSFLPLKPDVFLILTILAGGDHYGYGIMQAAEERSVGRIRLQAGALYRRLKWLLGEGMIEEVGERVSREDPEERRRYYSITPFGRRVASSEAQRMGELLAAADRVSLIRDPRLRRGS
ncbi:MAG: helix-turn-helix transcriptional regulator [Gemmatimonadota bacterium]|jgi:DNA-binding PadR family transcriptional regulator